MLFSKQSVTPGSMPASSPALEAASDMLARLRRGYPLIWPFVFLAGGIVAVASGGHFHFTVFGATVSLHTLMWFVMALAHADVIWRWRQAKPPGPRRELSARRT